MGKPKPFPRHEIDYTSLRPAELDEATQEELYGAVGIDPHVDGRERVDALCAEVGGLLALYPEWKKSFDDGPTWAHTRADVETIIAPARSLLERLDGLQDETRDLLTREPYLLDFRSLRVELLKVENVSRWFQGSEHDGRGSPKQSALRYLVRGLCRVFRDYRPTTETTETTEDDRLEFVRAVLRVGGIKCGDRFLRDLLENFPPDAESWPLWPEA